MAQWRRAHSGWVVAALAMASGAAAAPPPFVASYEIALNSIPVARLEVRLRYNGSRYQYDRTTRSSGIAALFKSYNVIERSEGEYCSAWPAPLSYFYEAQKGKRTKRETQSYRDGKVRGEYAGQPFEFAAPAGVQDPASMELAIMTAAALEQRELDLPVASHGKLGERKYQRTGAEVVRTPVGEYESRKIELAHRSDKRKTVYWLARNLQNLPVQLLHVDKEGELTITLQSIQITGSAPTSSCRPAP